MKHTQTQERPHRQQERWSRTSRSAGKGSIRKHAGSAETVQLSRRTAITRDPSEDASFCACLLDRLIHVMTSICSSSAVSVFRPPFFRILGRFAHSAMTGPSIFYVPFFLSCFLLSPVFSSAPLSHPPSFFSACLISDLTSSCSSSFPSLRHSSVSSFPFY